MANLQDLVKIQAIKDYCLEFGKNGIKAKSNILTDNVVNRYVELPPYILSDKSLQYVNGLYFNSAKQAICIMTNGCIDGNRKLSELNTKDINTIYEYLQNKGEQVNV